MFSTPNAGLQQPRMEYRCILGRINTPVQCWRQRRPSLRCAACAAPANTDAAASGSAPRPKPAGAAPQKQAPWTYKYKRTKGPSLCRPGDTFCAQVEALFQNVLIYPYVPPTIHKRLDQLRPIGIDAITDLVERSANHFGAELALYFFRRAPELMQLEFTTIAARCRDIRSTLGIPDYELPLLLRKNPKLMLLEPAELKARYEALPRVLKFTPLQVRVCGLFIPLVVYALARVCVCMACPCFFVFGCVL